MSEAATAMSSILTHYFGKLSGVDTVSDVIVTPAYERIVIHTSAEYNVHDITVSEDDKNLKAAVLFDRKHRTSVDISSPVAEQNEKKAAAMLADQKSRGKYIPAVVAHVLEVLNQNCREMILQKLPLVVGVRQRNTHSWLQFVFIELFRTHSNALTTNEIAKTWPSVWIFYTRALLEACGQVCFTDINKAYEDIISDAGEAMKKRYTMYLSSAARKLQKRTNKHRIADRNRNQTIVLYSDAQAAVKKWLELDMNGSKLNMLLVTCAIMLCIGSRKTEVLDFMFTAYKDPSPQAPPSYDVQPADGKVLKKKQKLAGGRRKVENIVQFGIYKQKQYAYTRQDAHRARNCSTCGTAHTYPVFDQQQGSHTVEKPVAYGVSVQRILERIRDVREQVKHHVFCASRDGKNSIRRKFIPEFSKPSWGTMEGGADQAYLLKKYRQALSNLCSDANLGKKVRTAFKLPEDFPNTTHVCRAIYANTAYELMSDKRQSQQFYMAEKLGHTPDTSGSSDYYTYVRMKFWEQAGDASVENHREQKLLEIRESIGDVYQQLDRMHERLMVDGEDDKVQYADVVMVYLDETASEMRWRMRMRPPFVQVAPSQPSRSSGVRVATNYSRKRSRRKGSAEQRARDLREQLQKALGHAITSTQLRAFGFGAKTTNAVYKLDSASS